VCFFNLGLFGASELQSMLEILICRKYSFLKQTKLSEGNSVIEITASNVDGTFSRYTCASSSQLKRPV
jgi:hypothetical protein